MVTTATATRRLLIDIARRRQKPGAGSSRQFLLARTTEMTWPDLTDILDDVAWAVVGAVATRLYMPERMTKELDVAVAATNASAVVVKLQDAGWKQAGSLTVGGTHWIARDGTAIDVLEGHAAWWPEALATAQSNRDAQGLPILPLPYLVLMKFQAGRVNDLADITRMLGLAPDEALDATRRLFAQYEVEGLQDLESLITLGRLELE